MAWRVLNGLLGLLMIGFTAVQYNDPDAWLWVVYYLVPAAWAIVAAFRPALLQSPRVLLGLRACVVIWIGLVVGYWPQMPNFWLKDVWIHEETAREGMGLMIALAALLVAMVAARRLAR